MNLPAVCIRRPVFTTMLTALPIVLGLFSYMRLGVDLQPNLDLPLVNITTTLRGASVEEVETQVTRPIEEAVNTIEGIDELRSLTVEGVSRIFVSFRLEKDADAAAQEVQNRVNAMVAQLPPGTTLPVIRKFDSDSEPVASVVVTGRRDLREVTEIARRRVKEIIETVPGVGAVSMVGDRRRIVRVSVDPDKLREYGLAIDDVSSALGSQNVELPGGRVEQGVRELVLRVRGRYELAARINELVISSPGGNPIRIRDVGRAEEDVEDPRSLARLDGSPAVALEVQKQSGANTVEVVHAVRERLKTIREGLPPDIDARVVRDQAVFIEASIEEVKFHLVLAALLVSATILLFIRDWRTTLIATTAIPASILATFACMDALGFTLNNITMLALVLAIGLVIDDAVVVHENIFRHMEEHGLDAMEASRIGTSEIALAVLATSLSLVVIFVPVAFMEGRVGRLFNSFGLTISFAILMSLFVSFTLTPMLCSRFLKVEPGSGHGSKANPIYRLVENGYVAVLAWSLRHKVLSAIVAAALIATGYPLLVNMPLEYIPRDDTGEFAVRLTAPAGMSLDRFDSVLREVEARVKEFPAVRSLMTTVGDTWGGVGRGEGTVSRGSIYVILDPLEERKVTQDDVMRLAREMMADYPDFRGAVNDVSAGGDSRGGGVDINLVGPDLVVLNDMTLRLVDRLRTKPGLVDVDTSLVDRRPELQVEIDRDRAADLGVSAEAVASSLALLVGGAPVSTFKEADEQYDIWLRATPDNRTSFDRINDLTIRSDRGELVPVGSLARLVEERGPSRIERLNRQRRTTITSNFDGISSGQALAIMTDEAKAQGIPPGYQVRPGFRSRNLNEIASNFALAFGLSLIFMYMVLAAQFESFTDPITILLALPLTFPFALASLYLLKQPMDIYAIFGVFMLVGIVKKNGILQIDYTNELRRRGVPRDEAILQANRTRLRPILMTTLMLVAGMIPIALGQGPGAASRASLAKVIIGGQTFSLLPTLLITPVSYALLDSLAQRLRRRPFPEPADTAATHQSTPAAAAPPLHGGRPGQPEPELVS